MTVLAKFTVNIEFPFLVPADAHDDEVVLAAKRILYQKLEGCEIVAVRTVRVVER